ncbi:MULTISPECIES: hypothetical protein [Streptomycetaceae]|nr:MULTISPECIES: hypothetical protein [Streptomycetaceae]MYS59673.1 hypothetical protein [Streptomyces sp. SID5468]CCB75428.1 putative secreted protein [Streptantibioticus cattleyicolor NRRL 8057 = DSM 46488]
MTTLVTVAVILAMIALGALVISLLNAQQAEGVAVHPYARFLPDPGARPAESVASTTRNTGLAGIPPARDDARRDHRDGGRGRLRAGSRTARARHHKEHHRA